MNNEIAVSFASLVKSNNGFFKSEKQSAFLLSKCQDTNTFVCGGNVYNNSFTMFYICDSLGVLKVEKYTPKSGKTVTTWERQTEEQYQANLAAKEASKARDIALQEAQMAKFQARLDAFNKALLVAQEIVKGEMIKAGTDEGMATRAVSRILKDQDGITSCMEALVKFPEFVAAWEAFNNEPGQ